MQEQYGRDIVKRTPDDIKFRKLLREHPGMTKGVPLDELSKVWGAVVHDMSNVAKRTDQRPWDPREFPDTGLAYGPKSFDRQLQEDNLPSHIGFAPRGRDPIQPGITHNYQPNEQAKALGTVIAAINDPRNSWIGLGPAAATMRGMRLLQPITKTPEMGGFRVPAKEMYRPLGAVRPNVSKLEVPSHDTGIRNDFLGEIKQLNTLAKQYTDQNAVQAPYNQMGAFEITDPRLKKAVDETALGQNDLFRETHLRPLLTSTHEGPPPPHMLRRMGFVDQAAQANAELDKIRREAQQWFGGKERQ
jgi:hypothetical protein